MVLGSAFNMTREKRGVPTADALLSSELIIPSHPVGAVVLAHDNGDAIRPGYRAIADKLVGAGVAALLLELCADQEAADVDRLGHRLVGAIDWVDLHRELRGLPFGCFGSAAALIAAADRPGRIRPVVLCGGRPDLASQALARVMAPTLFVAGGPFAEPDLSRTSDLIAAWFSRRLRGAVVSGALRERSVGLGRIG
jgi:putative phosphoribosyl transferase